MSQFYDQASLVMIPSGVKDGKVYSQKPLSTDGQLTFSRGADVEATRINSQGLIEKAKVNLLLQSNTFSTTWTLTNATITSGQSGYDGSSDAWLINITGGTSSQRVNQTISASGLLTLSVYAKAGTLNWISVRGDAPAVSEAYFNLATGTLGSLIGAAIDSSIESVGSGWYRCSVSFLNTTIVRIYLASGDGNINQSSGNVYLQDAQLNYGLVAQDYVETTTAAVVSGITDNMPRLNYDPANPTCPSLLLEPSRQNYVTHSDFIGASDWDKTGGSVTVTTNATTSPEGVVNASKLTGVGTSVTYVLTRQTITLPAADNYTMSAYFKYSNNDWVYLFFSAYDGGGGAFFNINSGTVGTVSSGCSASIQECKDGWYRCSVTAPIGASDLSGRPSVYVAYADGITDFPSVGEAQNQAAFIYGVCVERGSYSSSLIPTYGTSATRTTEKGQKTSISALFGATATTLFLDFVKKENALGWTITGGNGTKLFSLCQFDASNPTKPRIVFDDGVDTGGTLPAISNGRHKLAVSYSTNDTRVYIDGTLVLTDTSCTYYQMDRVGVNATAWTGFTNNTNAFELNQFLLIPSATSNADLATLTSL